METGLSSVVGEKKSCPTGRSLLRTSKFGLGNEMWTPSGTKATKLGHTQRALGWRGAMGSAGVSWKALKEPDVWLWSEHGSDEVFIVEDGAHGEGVLGHG